MPQDVRQLYAAAPVYDTLPGWLRDIRGVRAYAALPEPARRLVEYIAKGTGVPIRTVSTGPRRDETISVDIRP